MGRVTVQTTVYHEPREVDESEIPVLRAQGLLAGNPQDMPVFPAQNPDDTPDDAPEEP